MAQAGNEELSQHHRRIRERGVNPWVYWPVRLVLKPFLLLFFRMRRTGREHVPTEGPVILAANHRSFLDPFVIGAASSSRSTSWPSASCSTAGSRAGS